MKVTPKNILVYKQCAIMRMIRTKHGTSCMGNMKLVTEACGWLLSTPYSADLSHIGHVQDMLLFHNWLWDS